MQYAGAPQFSRNVYRDTPRVFAYMPTMHSESALVQTQAVALFGQLGIQDNLNFELRHKTIIDRFNSLLYFP